MPRSARSNQPYTLCSRIFGASGISGLRSRTRRGPRDSADAQASACWRYAVMIGERVLPPSAGWGDREHAEAEPAAEIAIARVALTPLAAYGHFGGEPDLVAGAGAVDR